MTDAGATTKRIGWSAPRDAVRRDIHIGQSTFGFLLTVPALVLFAALILWPFLSSFWLAFHRYTISEAEPIFNGLDNFRRLYADPYFWQSWFTTIFYVVVTSTLTTLLGGVYALLLNQPITGRAIIRAASLLPWILPSTVTACLWTWMFHGQYGVINAALLNSGAIDRPFFFLSSSWGAMLAIILAKLWVATPLVMLFVLAALQDLPQDQVEAAKLDGASDLAVVYYVVVPHLRRTLLVVVVLQALANLQKFDLIYAMTAGGPVRATMLLSLEVYDRAFQRQDIGMAAAIGVVWFATIAVMSTPYLSMLLDKVGRR